jgi:hypothetical protein
MRALLSAISYHQETRLHLGSLRGVLDVTSPQTKFHGNRRPRMERDGNGPRFLRRGERRDSIEAPVIVKKFNGIRVLADIVREIRICYELCNIAQQ